MLEIKPLSNSKEDDPDNPYFFDPSMFDNLVISNEPLVPNGDIPPSFEASSLSRRNRGNFKPGCLDREKSASGRMNRDKSTSGRLDRDKSTSGRLDRDKSTSGQLDRNKSTSSQLDRNKSTSGQLDRDKSTSGRLDRDESTDRLSSRGDSSRRRPRAESKRRRRGSGYRTPRSRSQEDLLDGGGIGIGVGGGGDGGGGAGYDSSGYRDNWQQYPEQHQQHTGYRQNEWRGGYYGGYDAYDGSDAVTSLCLLFIREGNVGSVAELECRFLVPYPSRIYVN